MQGNGAMLPTVWGLLAKKKNVHNGRCRLCGQLENPKVYQDNFQKVLFGYGQLQDSRRWVSQCPLVFFFF